ncbi:MAG: hypothetical protein J5716_05970 [Alphaproteobacteria bacterium]|nr:hypothetical protein [Alphaproteobacteria bacterium]
MMYERFTSVEDAIEHMNHACDHRGKDKTYLVDGKPRYLAQAVRMEDEYGLTGIAGRYKFVDGKEAPFAEYEYRQKFQKYSIADEFIKSDNPYCQQAGATLKDGIPEALKGINKEIEKLKELNPELKALNYDNRNITEAYRALIGITSQYNVDDVNAYLHSVRTGVRNQEVIDRVEKMRKAGIRFGWQPAAKTVDKIEAQLKERAKTKDVVAQAALNNAKSR